MSNDKGTTNFGANDAAAAIAAAKARKNPVGGVPMPPMPRLDQAPQNAHAGVQNAAAARRLLTPEEQDRLKQQGQYIPGVGSAYQANQPQIQNPTDTDGVEQPIDPRLAPRPPGSGLRPETVQQLEAVAAANTDNDDEELKKIKKEIDEANEVWETNEFGERVRSLLANKKRKEVIEGRCAPMDIADLLMTGYVTQVVPIIPRKFEPTFRSMSGEENLEVLRLMGRINGGVDQYILDSLSIYKLTCGFDRINGKVLPSHFDKDGNFNEEMFLAKFKVVKKMALPILADLVVNFNWFMQRVQKLTVVDDIKSF